MTKPILIGWKAIAEYLGVTVHAAKRWARKYKLPQYRLGGNLRGGGHIISTVDAIRYWVNCRLLGLDPDTLKELPEPRKKAPH